MDSLLILNIYLLTDILLLIRSILDDVPSNEAIDLINRLNKGGTAIETDDSQDDDATDDGRESSLSSLVSFGGGKHKNASKAPFTLLHFHMKTGKHFSLLALRSHCSAVKTELFENANENAKI